MSNLKEIRSRINSVKSTRQITSAMKMVAAAKLKKAQDAVINMRPYANKLHDIIVNIAKTLEEESISSEYLEERPPEKILLVVITSNKGLCGAFNGNVIKKTVNHIESKYKRENRNGNVSIYSIGKKGSDFFKSQNFKLFNSNDEILDHLNFKEAAPIITEIMESFTSKKFDKIEIIYNKFKNAAVQLLTVDKFLPIDLTLENGNKNENNHYDYIMEPDQKTIIEKMIPKTLRIEMYDAMLESVAAEHGARMTAMHMATDNASGLIKDLQLTYNKARQADITNEIIEVVSGAQALND